VVPVVLLILFSQGGMLGVVVVFGSDCMYFSTYVLGFSKNNVIFIMTAIAFVRVFGLTKLYVDFMCL